MRWDDLYVSGCGVWLGRKEYVADAVAQGRYDAEEAAEDGYESVSVSEGVAPPEMAVAAARTAVGRAGRGSEEFGLLLHASVGFQGIDHWSPAAYIQAHTIGGRAAAVEVKQASNGGMAALDLAAAHLASRAGSAAVLITTGDRYLLPAYDRYRSDVGAPRGDGGTALVLNRGTGIARLLSTVLVGDAGHEGVHRGGESWTGRVAQDRPVSLRDRRDRYRASGGDGRAVRGMLLARHVEVVETALKDAGAAAQDVARFVFPYLGAKTFNSVFGRDQLGIDESRTVYDWGRTVGHIGAGDQTAGLNRLLETRAVHPGDVVVLVGFGSGFTFGAAVLEITERPDWPVYEY